jgi:hypothetical protein
MTVAKSRSPKLSRARKAIVLSALTTFAACAQGVEPSTDADQRTVAEQDASEPEASDDEDAGDSPDSTDVFDAGAMDARAASDASARDAAHMDASEASVPSDAGESPDVLEDGSLHDAATYSCPSCMLKVQWNTSTASVSTQSIAGYMKLTNTGSSAIALSGVSVRYWLREPMAESMVVECYHWDDGKGTNKCTRDNGAAANTYSSLSARVVSATGDLRYIELSFPEAAGELSAGGAAPGALQLAFHLPSYLALMQSDDPSFDAALTATSTSMLFDAPKITAYLGNKLAWGSEPAAP